MELLHGNLYIIFRRNVPGFSIFSVFRYSVLGCRMRYLISLSLSSNSLLLPISLFPLSSISPPPSLSYLSLFIRPPPSSSISRPLHLFIPFPSSTSTSLLPLSISHLSPSHLRPLPLPFLQPSFLSLSRSISFQKYADNEKLNKELSGIFLVLFASTFGGK